MPCATAVVTVMTLGLVLVKAGIAAERIDEPRLLPLPSHAADRFSDTANRWNRSDNLLRDDDIIAEEARVHNFAVGPKTSGFAGTASTEVPHELSGNNATTSATGHSKTVEAFEVWEEISKMTKTALDDALRQTLPKLLELSYELELSPACSASLMSLLFDLRELKTWAVKMVDAWGKIPSGILEGTVTELGSYDECLSISLKEDNNSPFDSERFRGKYCMVHIKPPLPPIPQHLTLQSRVFNFTNTSLEGTYLELLGEFAHGFYYKGARTGVCIPSVCTKDELQRMINSGAKNLRLSLHVSRCETKEEFHLDVLQITVMCVLAVVIALLVLGTATDVVKTLTRSDDQKKPVEKEGKLVQTVLAFSIYKNTKLLLDTTSTSTSVDSIHGLRFLSMIWIILTHTYIVAMKETYSRVRNFMLIIEDLPFQGIVNAWVSVDTFFFMGALLATYTHLNRMESSKGKVNFPRIIFGRIFRLSFSECFAILLMFIWPLMANGPLWQEVVTPEVEKCKQYWYATVFYFNNWLPFEKMCLFHTWYLSADIQLFLLCLITLIPFYRNPRLGIILSMIITAIGCLSSGFTTMLFNSPPTPLYNTPNEMEVWKTAEVTHMRTYSHLGPYAIGAILGYIFHKKKRFSINAIFQILAWCFSLATGLAVLWGTFNWNRGHEIDPTLSFWYSALHRSVWTLAVAWVTFACETQRGGIIRKFLSWKAFVPLARLCYMIYLMHFYVLWTRIGVQRERISFSHYSIACEFTVNAVYSITLAFLTHLAFEAPAAALYKTHFKDCFKWAEISISRPEKRSADRSSEASSRL